MRFSFAFAALVGLMLAGCSDERWVTIPPLMMSCEELEQAEESQADFDEMMETMVGPGTCGDAGGLDYANDYRCEDDKVQVLCEEA